MSLFELFIRETTFKELGQEGLGVYSITVYAEKPAKDDRNCCEPGSSCC